MSRRPSRTQTRINEKKLKIESEIKKNIECCQRIDLLIKEYSSSDKATKKNKKFIELGFKHTIVSYNSKISFLRTHGFPDLPTLTHEKTYKPASPPHEIQPPKLIFISPVTGDEIRIAPCRKEYDESIHSKGSFFRISRRKTIPDFSFDMLMYMLQTFGISIERPKMKFKHIQLYRPEYLKDCVIFVIFEIKLADGKYTKVKIDSMDDRINKLLSEDEMKKYIFELDKIVIHNLIVKHNRVNSGDLAFFMIGAYCINDKCDNREHGIVQMRKHIALDITNNVNKIVCPIPNCKKEICVKCMKDFHGGTCHQTSDEQTLAVLQNAIEEGTIKICPSCKTPTEKKDGCNHLFCTDCKTHWCWGCKQVVDAGIHDFTH
jgi:hypothetical protein